MNLNEEVELLKGVPIFAKIEPAKLKLLAFTSERMTFAAGQEVCHQGDPGDAMYVILGGVADVLIDTADRADPRRPAEEERLHRRDRHPVRRAAHRHHQGARDRSAR